MTTAVLPGVLVCAFWSYTITMAQATAASDTVIATGSFQQGTAAMCTWPVVRSTPKPSALWPNGDGASTGPSHPVSTSHFTTLAPVHLVSTSIGGRGDHPTLTVAAPADTPSAASTFSGKVANVSGVPAPLLGSALCAFTVPTMISPRSFRRYNRRSGFDRFLINHVDALRVVGVAMALSIVGLVFGVIFLYRRVRQEQGYVRDFRTTIQGQYTGRVHHPKAAWFERIRRRWAGEQSSNAFSIPDAVSVTFTFS